MRPQAGHARDRRGLLAQHGAEDLVEVAGRVGADQQHLLAAVGQGDRRGAGQRGLADAALAGEEQVARRVVEELHDIPSFQEQHEGPQQLLTCFGGRFRSFFDAAPAGQLSAAGVAPLADDAAVDAHQRQAADLPDAQRLLHVVVLGERGRLEGEVVAVDLDALALEPVEVGGEVDQRRIDAGAADAGGAAERAVEDFMVFMVSPSGCRLSSSSVVRAPGRWRRRTGRAAASTAADGGVSSIVHDGSFAGTLAFLTSIVDRR